MVVVSSIVLGASTWCHSACPIFSFGWRGRGSLEIEKSWRAGPSGNANTLARSRLLMLRDVDALSVSPSLRPSNYVDNVINANVNLSAPRETDWNGHLSRLLD